MCERGIDRKGVGELVEKGGASRKSEVCGGPRSPIHGGMRPATRQPGNGGEPTGNQQKREEFKAQQHQHVQ